jgi:histidine triad (HIT) family protein
MSKTIFSKILRGEIPSHKVYEDALVLAFLDIGPVSYGHTLVIPKEPARTLDELSEESAAALGVALVKVARAVKQVTGVAAYNVLQNNEAAAHQAVFHVHFHVIPKPDPESGLGVGWRPSSLDHADAQAFAERLRAAIASVSALPA